VAASGEVDARIADATATLLARMDVAVPVDASGRVLWEILDGTLSAAVPARALPAGRRERATQRADESRVVSRLRALGYVE
jgi:hypothetical protein